MFAFDVISMWAAQEVIALLLQFAIGWMHGSCRHCNYASKLRLVPGLGDEIFHGWLAAVAVKKFLVFFFSSVTPMKLVTIVIGLLRA